MIRDLSLQCGSQELTCDVLVVGGGTVGLLIACELSARGVRVICLESGGLRQDEDVHPLNIVEQRGEFYRGAEYGRARCLGGTSTRWGGALIPFQAVDLVAAGFKHALDDFSVDVAAVESLFGLHHNDYQVNDKVLSCVGYVTRAAKWPRFRARNVKVLYQRELAAAFGPEVWINATACRFDVVDGRLRTVTARSPDGGTLVVSADTTVIAAGAIESTRLLQVLDLQNGGLITSKCALLGVGFFDHLSAKVAEVRLIDELMFRRRFGFKFESGGVMRSVRFEPQGEAGLRSKLPAHFAHVAFDIDDSRVFSGLRNVFRSLQRQRLPSFGDVFSVARGLPWLSKALYWRLIEKRLLYPDDAGVGLHVVIDQPAVASNRVTLSRDNIDRLGVPRAILEWKISREDEDSMLAVANAVVSAWMSGPLKQVASLIRLDPSIVLKQMRDSGGIYHPGGTTRIGESPAAGVVDPDLRVHAVPNIRVVATSVLASGGGANPTMTLLQLGMRCVCQLAGRQSSRWS